MLLFLGLMACIDQAPPEAVEPSECPASGEAAELVVGITHDDQDMAEVSDLVLSVSEGPSQLPIAFGAPLTLELTQGEHTLTVNGTFAYEGPNDSSGTGWSCTGSWSGCAVSAGTREVTLPLDCEITWQD